MPRVKLSTVSLYYEIHGNGHPVLLIAGLNSDNASWAGVCGRLAKHFRVIALDNRGSGRSNTPTMGGYIAQELAINYPERVGKLVLEATAPISSSRNNILFNDLLKRFENDRDNEALMRQWTYWSFSPGTFKRKNYIETFIKNASTYSYLQSALGFKGQVEAIASFDACAKIKNIKAKTLVIIGSDDILIYPEESMKLVKGIKGSIFKEIKNAGHCVHVENPDAFVPRVIKFLK
ncbi:MAG: alpha/beta hydrolase [Candidatus Omnitrophica bacterium]|nr:alpha/beta hydrolase [Candidatus Omnitrophota bacterium]